MEICSVNENPINRLRVRKPAGMYRRLLAAHDRKREKREKERGVSWCGDSARA